MANDPMLNKTAADYESLMAQMSEMQKDVAKLASNFAKSTAERGQAMAQDLSDGVADAARYVTRKGSEADARLESAVAANPYMALGIAAGLGLLIGALSRR